MDYGLKDLQLQDGNASEYLQQQRVGWAYLLRLSSLMLLALDFCSAAEVSGMQKTFSFPSVAH